MLSNVDECWFDNIKCYQMLEDQQSSTFNVTFVDIHNVDVDRPTFVNISDHNVDEL